MSDLWILLKKGDDIVSPQLHGMLSNAFFVSCLPGWDSDGTVDNPLHAKFIWSIMKISWWRHQMETFSALLALCAGNSPVPVNSPHKGQWRGVLMFSLICARINDWVNNREAGDLRRHLGHYDFTVKGFFFITLFWNITGCWDSPSGKLRTSSSSSHTVSIMAANCLAM